MNNLDIYRDALLKIKKDPVFFIENFLTVRNKDGVVVPFKLNPAQKIITDRFLELLATDGKVRMAIAKSRQQGISTLCKALMLWYAFVHPGINAITVSQTYRDLVEKGFMSFSETALSVRRLLPFVTVIPHIASMVVGIGDCLSHIVGYGAETRGENRGGTLQFMHLTEIEAYKNWEMFWAGLSQSLPPKNFVAIAETTSSGHGVLWSLYQQGTMDVVFVPWYIQPEYRLAGDGKPQLTDEMRVIQEKCGLDDDQMRWYAAKEKELGSHIVMQHEYPSFLSDCFVAEKDFSLFGFDLIDTASNRKTKADATRNVFLGIDPSRSHDNTGMVWRQGYTVTRVLNLPPIPNIEQLAERIFKELELYPADEVYIDTGNGFGALCDILSSRYNIYTTGVCFGSAASNRERYANKRAEMYGYAKKWLENGGSIPKDGEFLRQLNEIKYIPSHKLQLSDKSKYLRSPDIADAFVLTFQYEEYPEGESVNYINRSTFFEDNNAWRENLFELS